MIPSVHIVAFSGHRPAARAGRTEEELAACAPRLRRTMEALQQHVAATAGEMHLVSSLAAGADVIACECAIALGIPLHLILAKPEKEFLDTYLSADPAKDFSHWLPRARAILATVRADAAWPDVAVHPAHTIRVGSVSTTSPECYAETNTRLLEAADLLLALSNGEPSSSIAGTTHLINQAEAIGIPVMRLNPADAGEKPPPAIPDAFLPKECPTMAVLNTLRAHVRCEEGRLNFAQIARCLSKSAAASSRIYRRASAIAITCHSLATILAAAVASYYYVMKKYCFGMEAKQIYLLLAIVALIESILVAGGWYLERRLRKDQKQRIWLDCRFAREIMRGMEKTHPFLDPLFPDVHRQLPGWKRFAISVGLLLRREHVIPQGPNSEQIEEWKNQYLKKRLLNQINYYEDKNAEAARPQRFFTWLTHKSALAALLLVISALVFKIYDVFTTEPFSSKHAYWSAFLLLFLPILMPLLATVGATYGAVFDYGRRATRYREMFDSLKLVERILPTLHTLPDITQLIRQTEESLQDELIEWLSAQKKGLGH